MTDRIEATMRIKISAKGCKKIHRKLLQTFRNIIQTQLLQKAEMMLAFLQQSYNSSCHTRKVLFITTRSNNNTMIEDKRDSAQMSIFLKILTKWEFRYHQIKNERFLKHLLLTFSSTFNHLKVLRFKLINNNKIKQRGR